MKLWFERGAWASRHGRTVISEISPEDVRRIAVIRHAALGDMVLVRPFLIEARGFFPNAEIVLSIVSNYAYGLPDDLVDSVHILPGSDKRGLSLGEQISRAKALGPVDILFDLADTTRSRYLTLLTKSKVKIGFPYRWYLRNLLFDAAVFRSDFAFEAEAMLDTLKLLGANTEVPLRFNWPQKLLQGSESKSSGKVVYFPFASVQTKCWPEERFKGLISLLASEYPNFSHVILGGLGAQEKLTGYTSLAHQYSNVRLQDAMDLGATITLLSCAKLVISNDTGVRNLAIATETPTIGIFFSTVPHRYWPRHCLHSVAFEPDGSPPTLRSVHKLAADALNTYE